MRRDGEAARASPQSGQMRWSRTREDLGIANDPPNVEVKGYWTGEDARRAAYRSVFAGAAGHTYGNHSVWQFYDPARNKPDAPARLDLPWQRAIDRPAADQMRHLKALMLSRPYFTRIPDQTLIVGEAGEGEHHVLATRSRDGSYAMLFLPQGKPVNVDLRRTNAARVAAWWFDPRTGAAGRVDGVFPTDVARVFAPPFRGDAQDWVLVLDDESRRFPPPGAPQ